MNAVSNIATIILAAGGSSRMGQPKQLLPWKKTTLLGYSVKQALKSNTQKVYVVLGAYFNEIEISLREEPVDILKNKEWKTGMGSSIAFAINYLKEENFDGALFLLADQPQIDSIFINKLIAKWQQGIKPIIATRYNNKGGVPAIFSKPYFGCLSQLASKKGAYSIIRSNPSKTTVISPLNPIMDIDTQEEYALNYKLAH